MHINYISMLKDVGLAIKDLKGQQKVINFLHTLFIPSILKEYVKKIAAVNNTMKTITWIFFAK